MIRLLWLIDVYIGHRYLWDWLPDRFQHWYYQHVCLPSGLWECRDE